MGASPGPCPWVEGWSGVPTVKTYHLLPKALGVNKAAVRSQGAPLREPLPAQERE